MGYPMAGQHGAHQLGGVARAIIVAIGIGLAAELISYRLPAETPSEATPAATRPRQSGDQGSSFRGPSPPIIEGGSGVGGRGDEGPIETSTPAPADLEPPGSDSGEPRQEAARDGAPSAHIAPEAPESTQPGDLQNAEAGEAQAPAATTQIAPPAADETPTPPGTARTGSWHFFSETPKSQRESRIRTAAS